MINTELILAIITFALVTSITPGPNNIMLTASGANFGLIKTVPHIAGIVAGVALMNLCVGLGLGVVFQQFPVIQQILKVAGSIYLVWLALKMLRFHEADEEDGKDHRPFSFFQALTFQYVNPKAWMMVISANASFTLAGEPYWISVWLIIFLFIFTGTPSIVLWTAFGQMIRHFLQKPTFLKVFNIVMAVLTALCIVFIWS